MPRSGLFVKPLPRLRKGRSQQHLVFSPALGYSPLFPQRILFTGGRYVRSIHTAGAEA